MRDIPKYVSNKPFLEMSTIEKLGIIGKLLIFVMTMGFAYPRLISHWGEGKPSKKVETRQDSAVPAH
jgi:hypothetical protein